MTREDRFSLAPRSLASVDDTVLAAQMRKQNVAEKCAGIPSASGFGSMKPSKKLQTRFYSAAATSSEEDAKPCSPVGANKRFMVKLCSVNPDTGGNLDAGHDRSTGPRSQARDAEVHPQNHYQVPSAG